MKNIQLIVLAFALPLFLMACPEPNKKIQPEICMEVKDGDEVAILKHFNLNVQHVMHVGAHTGGEAHLYDGFGIKEVTWIEADPETHAILQQNIKPYGHRAIQALCSEKSGELVTFHKSSNEGLSSSLLSPKDHTSYFPTVKFANTIQLTTTTLSEVKKNYSLPAVDYLVLDVQGAEMMVLKGLDEEMLANINYMFLEVSSTEMYEGQALLPELKTWLEERNMICVAGCSTDLKHTNAFFVKKELVAENN